MLQHWSSEKQFSQSACSGFWPSSTSQLHVSIAPVVLGFLSPFFSFSATEQTTPIREISIEIAIAPLFIHWRGLSPFFLFNSPPTFSATPPFTTTSSSCTPPPVPRVASFL